MNFSAHKIQPGVSLRVWAVRLRVAACWAAVVCFLVSTLQTFAGGTVTSATEASLRAALKGGGLVTFSNDFAITISGQIVIDQSPTVIDAAGHNVSIASSNTVALLNAMTNLTLKGVTLLNGTSPTAGGALYIQPGALVIASHCVFAGNSALGTNGSTGFID